MTTEVKFSNRSHNGYSISHGYGTHCTGDWTDFEVAGPAVPEWDDAHGDGPISEADPREMYGFVPVAEVIRVCGIDPRPALFRNGPITVRPWVDRPKVYMP